MNEDALYDLEDLIMAGAHTCVIQTSLFPLKPKLV
jgi:hypothetical protein